MYLMERALDGIEHYPLSGLGANNFMTYSLIWHEVHMTYLQVAVEGGLPGTDCVPDVLPLRFQKP